MILLGIDPGKGGAIAALSSCVTKFYEVCKLDQTEADICAWIEELLTDNIGDMQGFFALIEKVHAMPQSMRGGVASFKLGVSYGFLRGLLTARKIPFDEISSQKWQRVMRCLSHGDKNITKAKAQQFFPHVKVTHANADALLIAEYARYLKAEPTRNISLGELTERCRS
jgi:hypothetical protein